MLEPSLSFEAQSAWLIEIVAASIAAILIAVGMIADLMQILRNVSSRRPGSRS